MNTQDDETKTLGEKILRVIECDNSSKGMICLETWDEKEAFDKLELLASEGHKSIEFAMDALIECGKELQQAGPLSGTIPIIKGNIEANKQLIREAIEDINRYYAVSLYKTQK